MKMYIIAILLSLHCTTTTSDHIPEPVYAGDGFTDTEFEGSRESRRKYDRRSPAVADELHDNIRCDEVVGKHHTECYRDYERCKDTHRCNRAEVDYDVLNARLDFFERTFNGGKRFGADMFYDFEDWIIGTHKFAQGPYPRGDVLGFSTFSSNTTGALEFNSGTLRINTTSLTMTLERGCRDVEPDVDGIENSNCTENGRNLTETVYNGVIHMTLGGTEVATFNFERVYLGAGVKVHTSGFRALSLLSRSSMIIDTPIIAAPGTLGGFPGGRLPDDFNSNGPGSGSRRVFEKTVTTRAQNVDEVQRITTSATPGENLAGGFTLKYCRGAGSKAAKCDVSERIPYDATAFELKQSIEGAFRYAGRVEVSRQGPDAQKAFIWTVSFTTAADIVPQLVAKSYLTGSGASVAVETLVQGNTIDGYFSFDFMGQTTRPIKHDVTEHQFRAILEADLPVETAHVVRNDPLHECDSGECGSNPFGAGGYHWKLVLVTPTSTLSPTSPTAKINDTWLYPIDELTGVEQRCRLPEADALDIPTRMCLEPSAAYWGCTFRSQSNISFTAGCRDPTNRQVFTIDPHWRLEISFTNLTGTNVSLVVTDDVVYELAFGGNGGANGGAGGQGRGLNPAAAVLGTPLEDLIGGSGGGAAGCHPHEVIERTDPVRGGNGGGAMYLSAYNDIILGYSAKLDVNGASGQNGRRGGGGGSGGSVAIHAGGVVTIYGTVTAQGGAGGDSQGVNMDGWGMASGGGGGGGRIAVTCESYTDEGTVTAKGGEAGTFPEAMAVLLRLSQATIVSNGTSSSAATTTWKSAEEPDDGIGNTTFHLYGWSVEDKFHSETHSTSTGVDGRLAATAGPGGIGGEGVVHVRRTLGVKMRVDPKEGASSTSKSLRIDGGDISNTSSYVLKHNPRQLDGPQFRLYKGSKPERVTVFVKMGGLTAGTSSSNWGIMLQLHGKVADAAAATNNGTTNRTNASSTSSTTMATEGGRRRTNGVYETVRGRSYGGGDGDSGNSTVPLKEREGVIDANFSSGWRDTRSQENTLPVAIAMGAVNGKFRHEGNPGGVPRFSFHDTVVLDRWYQIDIMLDWTNMKYDIRINGVEKVVEAPFGAEAIEAIGMNTWHSAVTWWDELYVGKDKMMGFRCPRTKREIDEFKARVMPGYIQMDRPEQVNWPDGIYGPAAKYHKLTHHESHLSRRFDGAKWYTKSSGEGYPSYMREVETAVEDGETLDLQEGGLEAGALVFIDLDQDSHPSNPNDPDLEEGAATTAIPGGSWSESAFNGGLSGKRGGRAGTFYWYGEHRADARIRKPTLYGGVGACSTRDFIWWRNEGIVLHYINVSTPFNVTGDHLLVERPKVLQCLESDRISQEDSLQRKLERDVANAQFVEDASREELVAKQQNQLAEENWLQYITIQGFDVLDYIIPQQKKLVGIRADTQVALDALYFSEKDRVQAEISLTIANSNSTQRRIRESEKPQGTLYIMWMHVDNAANTLGLTGVAQALYPNGPFIYKQSLYPDAPVEAPGRLPVKESHDSTVIVDPETRATFFVKTFFKDINYWLPRPVMQPLWESINLIDGNGTDFALSYHRGMYHRGYDDPEDIYLQRWRAEEKAWNHTCCYPSGRCADELYEPMQDIMILTPDSTGDYSERPYRAPYTYGNCPYGTVKRVQGQAANDDLKVKTKYFDPTTPQTNTWQANSVPPFSPWGFQVYNVKLWKEDYFQAIATDIVRLLFNRFDEDHDGVLSANDINTPTTSRLFDPLKELYVVLEYLQIEYTLAIRARYDPNYDMSVSLDEFRRAFGRDPDLLFDKYDQDKSSFLNVTEIEAVITELGIPRKMKKRYEDGGMATIGDFWTMKALDADDDEEVFYNAFERWLENAPTSIFDLYDKDTNQVLTAEEMATLVSDLGMPVSHTDLVTLDKDANGAVTFDSFQTWLRAYPSRLRNVREYLKVNNAPTQSYADELVGPMQVILTRRSKYIAVNEMSLDYTSVGRLVLEIEGEYSGGGSDNLISALGKMDLNNWGIRQAMQPAPVASRISLSPNELGFASASYFNGRDFERHQEAKSEYTYGSDCVHIAGVQDGCPQSLTHSPYLTSAQEYYEHYKTVIDRQDWIDKGAQDARSDCFGDRRLCDNSLYNPQDPEKYSTITEGVNLWNPQRQYPGIWGVDEERARLAEQRNVTNVYEVNNYASTPFNYKAFYNRTGLKLGTGHADDPVSGEKEIIQH